MQTDFENFLALYRNVGVEPTVGKDIDGFSITLDDSHTKIVAYVGFSTVLYFDTNGKFVEQSITES